MSYEILLSDTARADLEAASESVQALIRRISWSPELDHVLSAEKSDFELRYQSLGNTYVFLRRDESAQQVTIIYFCEMTVPGMPQSTEPKLRVLNQQVRDIPNGMEAEVTLEKTHADGSVSTHNHFVRKVEMGDDRYVTIVHQPPVGTMILTGKKGEVKGDFRHDELELLHLLPDGTVKRFPPNTVPVLIRVPIAMEDMKTYVHSPQFEERMQLARKWLAL